MVVLKKRERDLMYSAVIVFLPSALSFAGYFSAGIFAKGTLGTFRMRRGDLRLVRLWRGLRSWVTSDFPPLSTPSWTPNTLMTHRQRTHPFTPHRHLSHTVTNRHGISSHT